MLSVVIETGDEAAALARTLDSLVVGAIDGAVRQVIVRDRAASAAVENLCEEAGCDYLAGASLAACVAAARGDWLLFLEPGARLAEGWADTVLARTGNGAQAIRFACLPARLLDRFLPSRRPLGGGLLLTRAQAADLAAKAQSAEDLAGHVQARRLSTAIVSASPP